MLKIPQAVKVYFPATLRALKVGSDVQADYVEVSRKAVVEAALLLPKSFLGTRLSTSSQDALRPQALTVQERGLLGCVSLIAGKLAQYLVAGAGAVVGAGACAAGALAGGGRLGWIDLCAGKGWQLGTLVGACIVMPSELARHASLVFSFALFTASSWAVQEGRSVAKQVAGLAQNSPRYSEIA